MINSMTAFARAEHQTDAGTFTCELRSTNHRFLEISLHIPDFLRSFEMPIRDCIKRYAKRGKIDCALRFQPSNKAAQTLFTVNNELARELCLASEKISAFLQQSAPINPSEILRFPGVMESKQSDMKALEAPVLAVVDMAAKELLAARGREGAELKKLFDTRMSLMEKELAKVQERLPSVMTEARNRLLSRFNDARIELDATRLEQEMVMFAQKIDIAEEIDRASTHINEFRRTLNQDDLVGRRLDFLLQEMNREANTLGSKSVDTVLTHAAVEMKVLIEQVREQVQNVE